QPAVIRRVAANDLPRGYLAPFLAAHLEVPDRRAIRLVQQPELDRPLPDGLVESDRRVDQPERQRPTPQQLHSAPPSRLPPAPGARVVPRGRGRPPTPAAHRLGAGTRSGRAGLNPPTARRRNGPARCRR